MPTPHPDHPVILRTIGDVMEHIPTLNMEGFLLPQTVRANRPAMLDTLRRALPAHESDIMRTVTWIQARLVPINTCLIKSSNLRQLLVQQHDGWHITNGEMVAAGILAGLPWEHGWSDGPNVRFGISQRSINGLWRTMSPP